jgi:hypothetical protein
MLPIDAIQEFNTEQNPKAEYGWRDGSVILVGVKSGTNSIHGTAYAFGRDASATDAANYFTSQVTSATLQQFGATLGGPILKDKLFWFVGFGEPGIDDVALFCCHVFKRHTHSPTIVFIDTSPSQFTFAPAILDAEAQLGTHRKARCGTGRVCTADNHGAVVKILRAQVRDLAGRPLAIALLAKERPRRTIIDPLTLS